MAAPSFSDLFNLGKAEAIIKRPALGVRVGDISEMLISGAAAMADRIIGWFAQRIAATYLDGATGDDLTLLAADHWSIQRLAATKSVATVTISRSSPDTTSQTIAPGFVVATARDSTGSEVQFVTTSSIAWAASTGGNRTANVQAVLAGTSGNLAAPNLITRLITTPPAGGVYAIVSSTLPAGGAEEEIDEDLRDRVRKYPATLRRGTVGAVTYGAISTPSISVAKATATQDPTGLVSVYVSDASGNSTGTPTYVDPSTVDVGTMTSKVAVELLNWAPVGGVVLVAGGVVQTVDVTVTLTVRLGVDVAQLITDIQAAVTARMNRLNIGETLYISDLLNAVKAVDPDNVLNVVMVTPIVDTAPSTAGSIIRPGVITVS